jgi:uncharacterized protein YukE
MTVTLRPAAEDSPTTPTNVEPGDFEATANAFAAEQQTVMHLMDDLRSGLAANSPCIGQDASATYFASRYGPAADTFMNGCAELYAVIGNIAQGLAQAGTDHSRADAISATNWRTTDYHTITVNTYYTINPQVVPTITGHEPGWLPSVLYHVWPCKDDATLAGSIHAWQAAQQSLTDLQARLHSALTALVDNNQGPDLQALDEFWSEFTTGPQAIFPALNAAVDSIVAGLNTYGQTVDQFNGDLKEAILESAIEAGAEEMVFILADLASDGLGAVFTGPEGEAIAAQAITRLAIVVQNVTNALQRAYAVDTMTTDGTTALSAAIQAMPQPDVATNEAWQTGDDIQPAHNTAPRGDFNADETAISNYLQHGGHVVMPIYEDHSTGQKNTDALVDGQPVDFKTATGGGPRTIRTQLKKSEENGGQADEIVINAAPSPLSRSQVEQQLRDYFTGAVPPKSKGIVQRVTVLLADGSKVTWPPDYQGL